MKLYHGSKHKIDHLEKRQAVKGEVDVPEEELLNGIYLTPDYGFAIAMAARPENSSTTLDNGEHKMTFEKPELFKPEENIFIYTIDTSGIPDENLKYIDALQYVVLGIDQIPVSEPEILKAKEVLKYYEITNWKENNQEISQSFKLR
jgi:hypothetical protein